MTLVADLEALEEAVTLRHASSAEDADHQESSAEDADHQESSAEDCLPDPVVRWEPTGVAASTLTLATLLCERQVSLVAKMADGSLVDLGRSRRRPSAAITRTVLRRHDHRCAVPRCGARRHLHLHHVRHWSQGGPTSAANLVPLCGRHHRELHDDGLRIHPAASGAPGRWTFRDRWGRTLQALAPVPPADGPPLSEDPGAEAADRSGVGISRAPGRAERVDYDYALSVLAG